MMYSRSKGQLFFATVSCFLTLSVLPSLATDAVFPRHPSSGKKKLLLFAKNPATWGIIKGGGTGKVVYREADGTFTLNAEKLAVRTPYALIRVIEQPSQGEVVARGISNERGRLQVSGIGKTWVGKFWLVSGDDVAGRVGEAAVVRAWHPEKYLFEEKVLGIPCNCPEPEEP